MEITTTAASAATAVGHVVEAALAMTGRGRGKTETEQRTLRSVNKHCDGSSPPGLSRWREDDAAMDFGRS